MPKQRGFMWGLLLLALTASAGAEVAFDHRHSAWDQLLAEHVYWLDGGHASAVDYRGLQRERARLEEYLQRLSAVPMATFEGWPRAQQMAFLINAYNAFTVALILTEYPNLDSIKDLGSFWQSPWKREFFTLLGEERHLDWVEHEMLRANYREPLIHVAVNCASIGCPALRDEAFTAAELERQLMDSWRRFMSDRSRNRYNPQRQRLEVSKIFDWFGEDFTTGARGFDSLAATFAQSAALLSDDPSEQGRIRSRQLAIAFLGYDWGLNDYRAATAD